ncbi:hypothetical protein [Streptomyces rimosus]|uniref:hypothetical protein n=1 Tax=Streptomyces rimosus TaxID=1927 RepID=UPI00131BAAFD|nr:hypothetical protein [Streptomyces rimosus]
MAAQTQRRWDGPTKVSLDDWIAAELESAPEPSSEQRGILSALFDGVQPAEAA